MTLPRLGRRTPSDFNHISKYPLTLETAPTKPVPVTIGVPWYENFDRPVKDSHGNYWIGKGNLGNIRGGHCVCIPPQSLKDASTWYTFYNQGQEGACVGFGSSRMMSLLNRKRYDARWLWNQAKIVDEFPDTNPGDENGTTVRAAMDVLRTQGHVAVVSGKDKPVSLQEGISANRWATKVDEILGVLQSTGYTHVEAVPILNSWGKDYPHIVWLPLTVLQRLLDEEGEAALVTDK